MKTKSISKHSENLIMRNLAVLNQLREGGFTIEDLAKGTDYPLGNLRQSIDQLTQQGLVCLGEGGTYQLAGTANVEPWLSYLNQWSNFISDPYIHIAKQAARAILERSRTPQLVVDVMLYGSTLSSDNPGDIDLLLIHNWPYWQPYSRYGTGEEKPGEPTLKKESAWTILARLGYKEGTSHEQGVLATIEGIVNQAWGSAPVDRVESMERLNSLFDVHLLYNGLLFGDSDPINKDWRHSINNLRKEAIAAQKDPNFWYNIFSEGKIYDTDSEEFIPLDRKYPDALRMFPKQA